MTPTFAVVGHPNKGKSSIVATLAEDEGVRIGATPGTTRLADRYAFDLGGRELYVLVDTPGFQRAKAVLDWLQSHETNSSERPDLVRDFVEAHVDDDQFRDETTLLKPILDGAGIIYVVDGAKPFGAEFEIEMEVLRWTGRPRMALINTIGTGDYLDEWRQALDQYFSIVRVFDAMHADFSTRLNVLRAFGELDEAWRGPLDDAIAAMEQERQSRLERSAVHIAGCLADCLRYTEQRSLADGEAPDSKQKQLREKLQNRIRRREQQARQAVQAIYRHDALTRSEAELKVLEMDLFTREGWELFGLSKTQLLITGAVSGAVAGLGIDALVGGASLMLGAGIGALVGGVGTWFGSDELARTKVLGNTLGGRVLRVGPVSAVNFPWVLLGRAWAHHQIVRERNHALREAISDAFSTNQNLMDQIPEALRSELAKVFRELAGEDAGDATRQKCVKLVTDLLAATPA